MQKAIYWFILLLCGILGLGLLISLVFNLKMSKQQMIAFGQSIIALVVFIIVIGVIGIYNRIKSNE